MYICFGENEEFTVSVGRGTTTHEAISNWCKKAGILEYMQEYQKWEPTIIEGEEIQIDLGITVKVVKPE